MFVNGHPCSTVDTLRGPRVENLTERDEVEGRLRKIPRFTSRPTRAIDARPPTSCRWRINFGLQKSSVRYCAVLMAGVCKRKSGVQSAGICARLPTAQRSCRLKLKDHRYETGGLFLSHKRGGRPEDRGLAVQVSRSASAVQVILQLGCVIGSHFQVRFVCSDADVSYIRLSVEAFDES